MQTEYVRGLNPNGFHKIAVNVWGNTSSSGAPVICVHGLLRNGRDFDALATRLSQKRAVYCPDMTGRGLSENLPNPLDYNFKQYAADAVALIARTGAAQVDWVGSSMGGILGMVLAAQPNSPIRRLVINDIGPVIPKEALERIGAYLVGGFPLFDTVEALEVYIRQVYAPFGALTDAQWRHMAETSYRKTAAGKLSLAYDPRLAEAFQAMGTDIDLWPLYDKITCPTLVLNGAESDLLPAETAQEMTKRGPCAKLVTIAGAGHMPSLMDEAQTKMIEDFLEG